MVQAAADADEDGKLPATKQIKSRRCIVTMMVMIVFTNLTSDTPKRRADLLWRPCLRDALAIPPTSTSYTRRRDGDGIGGFG